MSAKLKPYPTTKDSGAPWLGEVPDHWEVLPAKRALRPESSGGTIIKNTASQEPKDGYVPGFSASGQDIWMRSPSHRGEALVLSAVGARCGRTFRASGDWGVVANTHVLRPQGNENRDYWWYVTNNVGWWERAGAAQPFVRVRATLDRPWAFPCPEEQSAIVRFLDHTDRRIRQYIRAKERLIELLEEQKQAVSHQAVAGHIDVRTGQPYPAYKDSEVEWLGEVPEHWRLVPLKWVARRFQNGATPPTARTAYYEGGTVPWYGPSSIKTSEEVGPAVKHLTELAFSAGGARLVRGPGLLIGVIGNVGQMALMLYDGSTNQQITAIELVSTTVSPRFILRQLRQAEPWLRSSASAATIPILDSGTLKRLPCALPPLADQHLIDGVLDSKVSAIDKVVVDGLSQISLADEYRTRLIADVVTGKLDVRRVPIVPQDVESSSVEDSWRRMTVGAAEVELPELELHP